MKRQLDNWLDSYLEYTNNTEPPVLFHKWVGISVIASALQRKCKLDWGSLTFYPNLYIVLVAPSGRARKGTAMSVGLQMLEEIGIKLAAESITREALVRELNDAQLTTVDPNTERVDFHSSLTVFSPELTVFLGNQNFQLMSDLTDWYDCRTKWTYRTKNMGTDEIKGVWVNLIGATTPSLIQTALPMDAIGGGLTSRIIFVFEQNKAKIVPVPSLTPAERLLRTKLVQDLEQIRLLQGTFKVEKDFVPLWVDWYHAQENKPPFEDVRFNGYIERRPNHVMKLCQIANASRTSSMIISRVDLETAISILDATEVKMPLAFSGVGRLDYADIITDVMTFVYDRKIVTIAELMSRYSSDVDYKLMGNILESLYVQKVLTWGQVGDQKAVKYLDQNKLITLEGGDEK